MTKKEKLAVDKMLQRILDSKKAFILESTFKGDKARPGRYTSVITLETVLKSYKKMVKEIEVKNV